ERQIEVIYWLGSKSVSSDRSPLGPGLRHDKACRRVLSNITNHNAATPLRRSWQRWRNRSGSRGGADDVTHSRTGKSCTIWIQDRTVSCGVPIAVGIDTRYHRNGLT